MTILFVGRVTTRLIIIYYLNGLIGLSGMDFAGEDMRRVLPIVHPGSQQQVVLTGTFGLIKPWADHRPLP